MTEDNMSDETNPTEPDDDVVDAPVVDDQGDAAPVVPTDAPEGEPADEQVTQTLTVTADDDLLARTAQLEAQVAEKDALLAERDDQVEKLEDRIADLEAAPAAGDGDNSGLGGVRTAALDAFEANQFKGEVQAWERETGLSYEDTEPDDDAAPPIEWGDGVDPSVQAKADAEEVG